MSDKEIEKWINKLSESDNAFFLLERTISVDSDLQKRAKLLSENLDIDYLEKELNLVVRFLSENNDANLIKLSKKGVKVVNSGGWIKYSEKTKSEKRKEKRKKQFSYWVGIIIPFAMLIVAIWTVKNDNLNQVETINKLHQEQKELIKEEIRQYKETLTKKMDSVLPMNEQTD